MAVTTVCPCNTTTFWPKLCFVNKRGGKYMKAETYIYTVKPVLKDTSL